MLSQEFRTQIRSECGSEVETGPKGRQKVDLDGKIGQKGRREVDPDSKIGLKGRQKVVPDAMKGPQGRQKVDPACKIGLKRRREVDLDGKIGLKGRREVDPDSKIGLKGRRKGRPGQKVGLEASFVGPAAVGRPERRPGRWPEGRKWDQVRRVPGECPRPERKFIYRYYYIPPPSPRDTATNSTKTRAPTHPDSTLFR